MKKSVISLVLASAVAALCLPVLSGCSASVGYTLATAEDGSKYYIAQASGYKGFLSGAIVISATYGEGDNEYPVKAIAEKGFAGTSITKVTIPDTVETIGMAAFAYNYSLNEVVFAEGSTIDEISWGCFGYCKALTEINIPKTVKTIDGMAFYGCNSISEIAFPDSLEYINISAFAECTALQTLNLPDGLLRIGALAFYNCISLESIILPDSLCSVEEPVLGENGEQQKDDDGNFVTRTIPAVDYGAFHTCTSLKFAVVGAGISSIEAGTFGYCVALEKIYLPAGLKKIEGALLSDDDSFVCGHPFHNDGALTDVYFAGSEEQWVEVTVDDTARMNKGVTYNNDAFINAQKHFNEYYGG